MAETREQALEVIACESLSLPSGSATRLMTRAFLNRIKHLEASKRRLVTAELAMRLWLGSLSSSGPYYVDFESVLWLHFSQNLSPEDQIRTIPTSAGIGVDVEGLYHMFLREMFVASGKTRHQFYQDMLLEVGIQMKLTDAEFGEKAMQFYERVAESVHAEHLLVFYSVGLLIRAYMAMDRKFSLPVADGELERIYRHFEKAIPLEKAFVEYASEKSLINEAVQKLFPTKDSTEVFYSLEFCDKGNTLGHLVAYSDLCMSTYEGEARERVFARQQVSLVEGEAADDLTEIGKEAYHFNCFAICQSSGLGKSKHVSALRNVSMLYVFDICLRNEDEPGEPSRTPHIAKAIEACKSKRDMLCVFAGCLTAQLASLMDPRLPSVMDRHPTGSNLDGETSKFFWAAAHKAACGEPYARLDEVGLAEACRSLLSELLAASGRKRVIFSLDEAAPLCKKRTVEEGTVFQDFLDALLVFPSGVFGILLDTSSRVHDFCPRKLCTRAVGRGRQPAILFPLFFCFPTHGILEVPEALSAMDTVTHPRKGSRFAGFLSCSFVIVSEARPSFVAHVRGNLDLATTAEGRSALLAKVVSTASRKLGLGAAAIAAEASRCGPGAQRAKDDLSLALLSVRLGMLSLDSAGVANLVANHMATLVAVSPENSVLYAEYVPEPLIAIAAFNEMAQEGRINELLGSVGNLLASGAASALFATGDAGEFAAAFMLMRAYDDALQPLLTDPTAPSYVGMPVTLGSYLEALLGPGAPNPDDSTLLDGFVCVLQTVLIEEKVEPADLLEAFRLRYAIICRKGEDAIDFIVPIALPSERERGIVDLAPSDMAGLLVQVKNWQSAKVSQAETADVFAKIRSFASRQLPGVEHISLLMAVGRGAVGGSSTSESPQGGLEIVLSGIDAGQSPCLASTTASHLRKVASGGTRQGRMAVCNQATYRGMDQRWARSIARLMQRQAHRTIPSDNPRSPLALPSQEPAEESIVGTQPEPRRRKRRATRD